MIAFDNEIGLVTSTREVMFPSTLDSLFLFVSRITQKNYSTDIRKNSVERWKEKKPLDFGANAAHVALGLGLR